MEDHLYNNERFSEKKNLYAYNSAIIQKLLGARAEERARDSRTLTFSELRKMTRAMKVRRSPFIDPDNYLDPYR